MPENDNNKKNKLTLATSNERINVGSSNMGVLKTGQTVPPILVSSDPHVNHMWEKLSEGQRHDIFAKLIGLLFDKFDRSVIDIDWLVELSSYGAASHGDAFILHDPVTEYHISGLIRDNQCIILAVWPFNSDDMNGLAYNRKPESMMPIIEGLYIAYMN